MVNPREEHAAYEEFQAVNQQIDAAQLMPEQRRQREELWEEASSLCHSFDVLSTDEVVRGIEERTEQLRTLLRSIPVH